MTLSVIALILSCVALLITFATLHLTLKVHGRLSSRPLLARYMAARLPSTTRLGNKTTHDIHTWVIYNPVKVTNANGFINHIDFENIVTRQAHKAGYPTPTFIATTAEDNGHGQTQRALENNADLVICAGGDGTVRNVAGALAHSDVPMAIIPIGTGNLLATNLGLPLNSLETCMELCFTGGFQALDVGFIRLNNGDTEEPFTVIAGLGYDGDIMANTRTSLKNTLGKTAYVVSGVKSAARRPVRFNLKTGTGEPERNLRALSIMFVNCGFIAKDLPLVPDASPFDGWMEVARFDVRAGLFGWTEFITRTLIHSTGFLSHAQMLSASLDVSRAREAEALVASPQQAQVDGDPIGMTQRISVRVEPSAVLIRY